MQRPLYQHCLRGPRFVLQSLITNSIKKNNNYHRHITIIIILHGFRCLIILGVFKLHFYADLKNDILFNLSKSWYNKCQIPDHFNFAMWEYFWSSERKQVLKPIIYSLDSTRRQTTLLQDYITLRLYLFVCNYKQFCLNFQEEFSKNNIFNQF